MSIDELFTKPCPNCHVEVPDGMAMCPNCGFDLKRTAVWPPTIDHNLPPSTPLKNWTQITFQVVGGFPIASVLTFIGTIFLLAGPIISTVLFFTNRKSSPYFANGILAGLVVGLVGVGACFAMLGKSGI